MSFSQLLSTYVFGNASARCTRSEKMTPTERCNEAFKNFADALDEHRVVHGQTSTSSQLLQQSSRDVIMCMRCPHRSVERCQECLERKDLP